MSKQSLSSTGREMLREEFRKALRFAIDAGVKTDLMPKHEMALVLREEAEKLNPSDTTASN